MLIYCVIVSIGLLAACTTPDLDRKIYPCASQGDCTVGNACVFGSCRPLDDISDIEGSDSDVTYGGVDVIDESTDERGDDDAEDVAHVEGRDSDSCPVHDVLVVIDDAVGDECADIGSTGKRIMIGCDDGSPGGIADDEQLSVEEIITQLIACDASETELALVEPAGDATGCESGSGVRIAFGTDDGTAGGIAGNGDLEPGEVDYSDVYCACTPCPPGE